MKTYFKFNVLRRTLIQFNNIFREIKVARYTTAGVFRKYLTVPIKLGPKSKAYYWKSDRKEDPAMPMIGINMVGIDPALERMGNVKEKILSSSSVDDGTYSQFLNPVPYNISVELTIIAKYLSDLDQIIEQILPYFNPHGMIRINIEEIDFNFDVKVLLTSVVPDFEIDIPEEDNRKISWNLTFEIQGYLFRPTGDAKMIKKIITRYFDNLTSFGKRDLKTDGSTLTTFTSGASGYSMHDSYIKGTGYDDNGAVVYDYEVFEDGGKVG